MQKKIFVFTALFFCVNLLYGQVNFQEEFSFVKVDPDDELTNLKLFDYDNNGIEDVVISYKSNIYNNCWRIICYSQTGSILKEFFQENSENEFFQKGYLLKNDNITYLLNTFIYRSGVYLDATYLRIKIYDFNTDSLICGQDYLIGVGQSAGDDTFISYSINTSGIIHQILSTNEIIFYIGTKHKKYTYTTQVDEYTVRDKSMIYKFHLSNNNINFVEEVENAGERITKYDSYDWIISTGAYYFHGWSDIEPIVTKSRNYRINLISPELLSQVQEVYYICGNYNNYYGEDYYEHYPQHYKILTNNDLDFFNYGLIAYYKEYDTYTDTTLYFINLSYNFTDTLWINNDSFIGDSRITSSTCIPVNEEDHFVMYFRGDKLEIRDRNTGNIVHHQDSVLAVCDILRKSDGELLFFVEKSDETGYDVYSLDGPIFVSADEPHNQNDIIIEQYPNPFHFSTTFSFFSKEPFQNVELRIYNIKGQLVRELKIQNLKWKINEAVWDGKDEDGGTVAQGIYFYKCNIDDKNIIGKMIKIK